LTEKDKRYYTHLLPEESKVWRRFLEKYEDRFERYEYDIHVGKGAIPPGEIDNKYKENFSRLTRKRIDVVGFVGTRPVIIEVRPYVAYHLAGKLEGYRYFWTQEHPDDEPPALLLICEWCNNEDRTFFASRDIEVAVV